MKAIALMRIDWFSAIHLFARILSVVSIGTLVLFAVGEDGLTTKIVWREWLGLIFFPFGVAAGMLLAWWRAVLGGAIAIGSLIAFYAVFVWVYGESFWQAGTVYFFVFTVPGFLFLINGLLAAAWLEKRRAATSGRN